MGRLSIRLTFYDCSRSLHFLDGKFHLLPTGELLVHSLEFNDQLNGYKCRTMHRLTRQVVVSSAANIRIAGESRLPITFEGDAQLAGNAVTRRVFCILLHRSQRRNASRDT